MSRWVSRAALATALVVAGALLLAAVDRGAQRRAGPSEAPDSAAAAGERRGALVDQVVFTQESDLGRLTELVKSGSHHVFGSGATNATIFRAIRDAPDVAYETSYGTSGELTSNPAGPRFDDGRINPFHVREIREAMHWLVDRRYIAEELYGSLAVPRYLPLNTAFPDYARLAEVARGLQLRYAHDPQRAHQAVREQMLALGAGLVNGRWVHEGEPIRLRVLIRVDDERRRVGDYFYNLLEDIGFLVDLLYSTHVFATVPAAQLPRAAQPVVE